MFFYLYKRGDLKRKAPSTFNSEDNQIKENLAAALVCVIKDYLTSIPD